MYVNCLLAMENFKLQFNQRGGRAVSGGGGGGRGRRAPCDFPSPRLVDISLGED